MLTRRTVLASAAAATGAAMFPLKAGAAQTAREAGFFLPDETHPHERTFIQWPVSREVHPDGVFLAMLQKSIAGIANAIGDFEPVVMLMAAEHQKAARKFLGAAVDIWDVPTDDLWARDSGPAFVIDGKGGLAMTSFNFNGWGNKQGHGNDGKIASRIAARLGLAQFDNGLVGEAGGVEQDGDGTLIAHESSWVNTNRNAGSKAEVEALMLQALGAEKMIWAPGVRDADITDYHIDALVRYVGPGKVLIQMPEKLDEDDPWSRSAFETLEILKQARDAKGRALGIHIIPEPYDIRITSADFVSSYPNYYVCNGAVISAQFGDKETDAEVARVLAGLYPGRQVVALNTDPVGEVGGGIHCATHEQPKA